MVGFDVSPLSSFQSNISGSVENSLKELLDNWEGKQKCLEKINMYVNFDEEMYSECFIS